MTTKPTTKIKLKDIDARDMPAFLEQHFNWLNAQPEPETKKPPAPKDRHVV